jgi:hypothetical protein
MTDKPGGKAIKRNPALKPFEVLVGEWEQNLSLIFTKL